MALVVLLVVALVTPVGANILFRGGFGPVAVTEPGILILLGAAMVAVGVSTRRFFNQRRLLGSSRV